MNISNYQRLSISIAFSHGWLGLYKLTQWEHKHFHPSGDPAPSKEDISITERIKESWRMLGIELIDITCFRCDCIGICFINSLIVIHIEI